jgi:hypothetical protein
MTPDEAGSAGVRGPQEHNIRGSAHPLLYDHYVAHPEGGAGYADQASLCQLRVPVQRTDLREKMLYQGALIIFINIPPTPSTTFFHPMPEKT